MKINLLDGHNQKFKVESTGTSASAVVSDNTCIEFNIIKCKTMINLYVLVLSFIC